MVGEIQLAFIAPPNDNKFIIEIICYDCIGKIDNEGVKAPIVQLNLSLLVLGSHRPHISSKIFKRSSFIGVIFFYLRFINYFAT